MVLADDHARVRAAVRTDLETAGFEVVGEASDADGAVDAALQYRPDVCLLDVRMPGNGLVAAWVITEAVPQTKVVMMSMSRTDRYILSAFRAGAVAYLLKDVEGAELASQLRAVVSGDVPISPSLAGLLMGELGHKPANGRKLRRRRPEPRPEPSVAELGVLDVLRGGASPLETASRLGLTEEDVRAAVADAVRRLRFAHRSDVTEIDASP